MAGRAGDISTTRSEAVQRLRHDLQLVEVQRRPNGAPGWLIEDPAANAFFDIGGREFQILSCWPSGAKTRSSDCSPESIVAAVRRDFGCAVSRSEVKRLAVFLDENGLTQRPAKEILKQKLDWTSRRKMFGPGLWLSEKLLFRKIPLFRPQKFLRYSLPAVQPLFSRRFAVFVAMALAFGLYCVMRQTDTLMAGLARVHTLESIVAIAVALAVAKSIHELAHAFSATRHGVDVPVMGVAFLLLFPVLYTETSGAWRLRSRLARAEIAAAGIVAELCLAAFSLAAWGLLGEGTLRDAMLFAATTLVVLTILFNANPFLKFDGYFIAMEFCGIDNLQSRALALLRWHVIALFAGSTLPCPECEVGGRGRRLLVAYAAGVICYRVFLQAGIAIMAFAILPPVVAWPVVAALLGTFIVRPAIEEIIQMLRTVEVLRGRAGIARMAVALVALAAPLFVPWSQSLEVPALIEQASVREVYLHEAGLISGRRVGIGDEVGAGAPLLDVSVPNLVAEISSSRQRLKLLRARLRGSLTDVRLRESRLVDQEELRRLTTRLNGLSQRIERQTIRAPARGRVEFISAAAMRGGWVGVGEPVLRIISPGISRVIAFVPENDVQLVFAGARASVRFAGLVGASVKAVVRDVGVDRAERIDFPMLASTLGGPIAGQVGPDQTFTPERSHFPVRLDIVTGDGAQETRERQMLGFVRIEAQPVSLAWRIWRHVVGLWRREFG